MKDNAWAKYPQRRDSLRDVLYSSRYSSSGWAVRSLVRAIASVNVTARCQRADRQRRSWKRYPTEVTLLRHILFDGMLETPLSAQALDVIRRDFQVCRVASDSIQGKRSSLRVPVWKVGRRSLCTRVATSTEVRTSSAPVHENLKYSRFYFRHLPQTTPAGSGHACYPDCSGSGVLPVPPFALCRQVSTAFEPIPRASGQTSVQRTRQRAY